MNRKKTWILMTLFLVCFWSAVLTAGLFRFITFALDGAIMGILFYDVSRVMRKKYVEYFSPHH